MEKSPKSLYGYRQGKIYTMLDTAINLLRKRVFKEQVARKEDLVLRIKIYFDAPLSEGLKIVTNYLKIG